MDYNHLQPVASLDFLNQAADNVHMFDTEETHPQLIGSLIVKRASSVFRSYIVPPEVWRYFSTKQRKENWVTPQIPDNVSLEGFKSFSRTRIAYVSEYNWERTGARGMYSITHYGYSNFGLVWVIGSPIAPDLFSQFGLGGGLSGARFAILARNTFWASAALGGLDTGAPGTEPVLIVHYNDGPTYHMLRVPWTALTDYVFEHSTVAVRQLEWPNRAPGTSAPPMISPEFEHIDMQRFWPQLMTALDIALYSPTHSKNLFAEMSKLPHWSTVKAYLEKNSGKLEWLPPRVEGRVGKMTQPDYMRP